MGLVVDNSTYGHWYHWQKEYKYPIIWAAYPLTDQGDMLNSVQLKFRVDEVEVIADSPMECGCSSRGLCWPHGGWAQMEFSPDAFGFDGYSTMFEETHSQVYYVHNYSKVQSPWKNLSYLLEIAKPKQFCVQLAS